MRDRPVLPQRDRVCGARDTARSDAPLTPPSGRPPPAVTFALYADGKDRILPADLRTTLSAVLRENDVLLSDGQVDRLVADTFTTYDRNHDGAIDFEEYHDMCVQNPALLKHLTINVSEVLAGGA